MVVFIILVHFLAFYFDMEKIGNDIDTIYSRIIHSLVSEPLQEPDDD
jgi:hypothetical protein